MLITKKGAPVLVQTLDTLVAGLAAQAEQRIAELAKLDTPSSVKPMAP